MRLGLASLLFASFCLAPDFEHLSWSPRSAAASTFVELSLSDLVTKSTLVLAATPVDARSLWEDSEGGRGRRIVTYTRLRVDRVIDGRVAAEVWVRTLGGHVGDIGQHVEGEAVLVSSKASLLFLRALNDGTHAVVGMSQGQYPLEPASDGTLIRLQPSRALGHLIRKGAALSIDHPPARLVLSGQTLDEAARLVLAERRAHAP
jgi:hypothetical protein